MTNNKPDQDQEKELPSPDMSRVVEIGTENEFRGPRGHSMKTINPEDLATLYDLAIEQDPDHDQSADTTPTEEATMTTHQHEHTDEEQVVPATDPDAAQD